MWLYALVLFFTVKNIFKVIKCEFLIEINVLKKHRLKTPRNSQTGLLKTCSIHQPLFSLLFLFFFFNSFAYIVQDLEQKVSPKVLTASECHVLVSQLSQYSQVFQEPLPTWMYMLNIYCL